MNVEKKSFVPKTSSRARCFSNFPRGKNKKINLILAVLLAVVFIKFAMLLAENKSENKDEGFAVRLNLEGDFPNPKEGTAIFNMKLLMDQIILQSKKVPKYVIFTESKTIPSLILRYNVHDSIFEGGLPLMKSQEVVFLDGNIHEIVYTFKEGAEQKFYFDKTEVASSKFESSKIGITGFAVSSLKGYKIETINVEGGVEFR